MFVALGEDPDGGRGVAGKVVFGGHHPLFNLCLKRGSNGLERGSKSSFEVLLGRSNICSKVNEGKAKLQVWLPAAVFFRAREMANSLPIRVGLGAGYVGLG